jgi:hypothetical protein
MCNPLHFTLVHVYQARFLLFLMYLSPVVCGMSLVWTVKQWYCSSLWVIFVCFCLFHCLSGVRLPGFSKHDYG